MARIPQVSQPPITAFTSLQVGPLRQAAPADTAHQVLLGTPVHTITLAAIPLTVAAVANAVSAEQTFVLTGNLAYVKTTDIVFVQAQSSLGGVVIGNARISTTGTLVIEFANPTAAPVTPGAVSFFILVVRP